MRLLLINPNTNAATTAMMRGVARDAAPAGVVVEAATAPFGTPLITDEAALVVAARAVVALAETQAAAFDGVIVAAFGDPGLETLRERLACPVVGIAEAGMAEAAASGRFAVVTTTADLADAITARARAYGHADRYVGTYVTRGAAVTDGDPAVIAAALTEPCREAARDGAEAVVVGGGPLALAARAIAPLVRGPVVEPIPAAVRLIVGRVRPMH